MLRECYPHATWSILSIWFSNEWSRVQDPSRQLHSNNNDAQTVHHVKDLPEPHRVHEQTSSEVLQDERFHPRLILRTQVLHADHAVFLPRSGICGYHHRIRTHREEVREPVPNRQGPIILPFRLHLELLVVHDLDHDHSWLRGHLPADNLG